MRVQVSDAHHVSDDDARRRRGHVRVARIPRAATSAFDVSARDHSLACPSEQWSSCSKSSWACPDATPSAGSPRPESPDQKKPRFRGVVVLHGALDSVVVFLVLLCAPLFGVLDCALPVVGLSSRQSPSGTLSSSRLPRPSITTVHTRTVKTKQPPCQILACQTNQQLSQPIRRVRLRSAPLRHKSVKKADTASDLRIR
jgi:hypothetical protein